MIRAARWRRSASPRPHRLEGRRPSPYCGVGGAQRSTPATDCVAVLLQAEGEDNLKKVQLMELAILNGTYRDANVKTRKDDIIMYMRRRGGGWRPGSRYRSTTV